MTADQQLIKDILLQAISEFEANSLSAKTMRRFAFEAPELFTSAGVDLLLSEPETAGSRYLARLVSKQATLFQHLASPWRFDREQAIHICRRLMHVDPTLDTRLARHLPGRDAAVAGTLLQGPAAERALDILNEVSIGRRVVPILSHLIQYPDKKISSKTILFIGKRVQSVSWAKRLIDEGNDPRIRANVIESVWGVDSPGVTTLFRYCLQDRHNRVVGNSIIGLHLAGDGEVQEIVQRLATEEKAEFRMTAAWTIGRIGDPELTPTLTTLMRDSHPNVRRAALRAIQRIRRLGKQKEQAVTAEAIS